MGQHRFYDTKLLLIKIRDKEKRYGSENTERIGKGN